MDLAHFSSDAYMIDLAKTNELADIRTKFCKIQIELPFGCKKNE